MFAARIRLATLSFALTLILSSPALAGPREQAKRLHDRLVGVPPSAQTLDDMAASIMGGDPLAAAFMAMEHPLFYSSSVRNWATPWTNEGQSIHDDLNDYSATIVGIVRDDVPFNQVLSADLVYVGAPGVVQDDYSQMDNLHYEQLQSSRADLSDPAVLVPMRQSDLPDAVLMTGETAGVITTRAAGKSFFSGGTNRRMWRYIAINYMCRDMEELNDITRPAGWVRQDVSRSPGGDSQLFHNTCVGCHSGMDALTGAFAYYEWDGEEERVIYTPGEVQEKFLINSDSFPFGFVTTNDSWVNYWRAGPNAALGWRGDISSGFGAKSLGQEVANSRAFSECQVEKAFQHVCQRPLNSPADYAEVERIADVFEANGYSMQRVFAETAVYCMGN
jgi:hypothetical protein